MIRLFLAALVIALMTSSGLAGERPKLEKSTRDAAYVAAKIIVQARAQTFAPKFRKG